MKSVQREGIERMRISPLSWMIGGVILPKDNDRYRVLLLLLLLFVMLIRAGLWDDGRAPIAC